MLYMYTYCNTTLFVWNNLKCTWAIVHRLIDCSFSQFLGVFRMLAAQEPNDNITLSCTPLQFSLGTSTHLLRSIVWFLQILSLWVPLLKGVWHENFSFWFFHRSFSPQGPETLLKSFKILQKFANKLKVKVNPLCQRQRRKVRKFLRQKVFPNIMFRCYKVAINT